MLFGLKCYWIEMLYWVVIPGTGKNTTVVRIYWRLFCVLESCDLLNPCYNSVLQEKKLRPGV